MLDVTVTPESETEVVSQKEVKKNQVYIDVEEIRKAYPKPSEFLSGNYCVGGALNLFLGQNDSGMDIGMTAVNLQILNPRISDPVLRYNLVTRIWLRNDADDFEGAWQALKETLEYGCDTSKETNDETRAAAQPPG